jgi:hypothetical protein
MSRVCPDCGQAMVNGFLQTGGGTAAFVREPRTLLIKENSGDFRLPVSRLTKTCPAWYCPQCRQMIVSLKQEPGGAEIERAARGEL